MGLGIGSMEGLIDYDVLATKIASAMSRGPKEADVLWNADECSDYLRIARRQFVDRISKHRNFPKARATGSVWLSSEVVRWAKKA